MSETTTAETPKTRVAYNWDDASGKITRQKPEVTGPIEHVATRQPTGALYYVGNGKQYAVGITNRLKSLGIPFEVMEVKEKPVDLPPELEQTQTVATVSAATYAVGDPCAGMEPRIADAIRKLRYQLNFPQYLEKPATPAPRQSKESGDKTPAYAEWLLRFDPAKFVSTYGIMGIGSIEVVVKRPEDPSKPDGKMKRVREREEGHVIARRKMHLTQKYSHPEDLGDE